MTDLDENLLTSAKLREQIRGDLEGDPRFLDHAGLVPDPAHRSAQTFAASAVPGWEDTELAKELHTKHLNDEATKAVHQGNGSVMSHLVGVTEQDLDASAVRLPMMLLDQLDNNQAPAFVLAAGNPNTGKTNTVLLLTELRKLDLEDVEIIANFSSSITDRRVTSAHQLALALTEDTEKKQIITIDEGSTHFDARTYRHEVATQWTPLAKRFAKLNVDFCSVIIHTGKDAHPEVKRLSTFPFFKHDKKTATFYERWPSDADMPADSLFQGDLENLEKSGVEYDPDDSAPWKWNLESELFAEDLDWPELHQRLLERGPQA